ncbi:MAG: hypothetical protein IKU30_01015 [Clostridia bacterium]|nr:hypothetical protein [Clostridia bacterium]
MRSVLISIKPQWCELIANGQKTIEVRKTHPTIETPFKCYIYECNWKDNSYYKFHHKNKIGKVIGEFICDKIEAYEFGGYETDYLVNHTQLDAMRLNYIDLIKYGKCKTLYGWHISNLVIYDESKKLSDFMRVCDGACSVCSNYQNFVRYGDFSIGTCDLADRLITRAPQSWCYVEEVEQ